MILFLKPIHSLFFFFCLSVLPRIRPFTFEEGPAQTGQYLTLYCSVSFGDLPLNITWLLNNEIAEDENISGVSTMMVNKRTSVLTIDSVDDHHAGNYTCLARNRAGLQTFTTELNVYG